MTLKRDAVIEGDPKSEIICWWSGSRAWSSLDVAELGLGEARVGHTVSEVAHHRSA